MVIHQNPARHTTPEITLMVSENSMCRNISARN
uniref:Uncharacterized protein n=1 Tax=Rhizophora mucronata TaxID=61149 RepID=A0A2P2R4N2_RHIMU